MKRYRKIYRKRTRGRRTRRTRKTQRASSFSAIQYMHPCGLRQDACSAGWVDDPATFPPTFVPWTPQHAAGSTRLLQQIKYPCTRSLCTVISEYGNPGATVGNSLWNVNSYPLYGISYPLRIPIFQHLGNLQDDLKRFVYCKPLYMWIKYTRFPNQISTSRNPYTFHISAHQNPHQIDNFESLKQQPHRIKKLMPGRSLTLRYPILVNKPSPIFNNALQLNQHVLTTNPPPIIDVYPSATNAGLRKWELPAGRIRHPWIPTNFFQLLKANLGQPGNPSGSGTDLSLSYFKYMLQTMSWTGPLIFITSPLQGFTSDQASGNPSVIGTKTIRNLPVFDSGTPLDFTDMKVQIGVRFAFKTSTIKALIPQPIDAIPWHPSLPAPQMMPPSVFTQCTTQLPRTFGPTFDYVPNAPYVPPPAAPAPAAPTTTSSRAPKRAGPFVTSALMIRNDAPLTLTLPPVGTSVAPTLVGIDDPNATAVESSIVRQEQHMYFTEEPFETATTAAPTYRDL